MRSEVRRVPGLHELVNGFSYEVWSEGYGEDYIEDDLNWYRYTVGEDSWRSFKSLKRKLEEGNIREDMPNVFNKYKNPPKDAVFIGRPTDFGNPYSIGKDGNREEVYAKYDVWIWLPKQAKLRKKIREELQGKTLYASVPLSMSR